MMRRALVSLGLLLAACGTPPEPKPIKTPVVAMKPAGSAVSAPEKVKKAYRDPLTSPNGDQIKIGPNGGRIQIVQGGVDVATPDPALYHAPPANRSFFAITASAGIFLDDGTLVVGAGDGMVTALETPEKAKWSVGFRGIISGLVQTDEGSILVSTKSGIVALLGADGKVHWEKQAVSDAITPAILGPKGHIYVASPQGVIALSSEGEVVFTHAASLDVEICCKATGKDAFAVSASGRMTASGFDAHIDDPHPPIASAEPAYPIAYRKILGESAASILATGPDEFLVLTERERDTQLLRVRGGKVEKRIPVPKYSARLDLDEETQKRVKAELVIDDVVMGPNGNPWLFARRVTPLDPNAYYVFERPLQAEILEVVGDKIKERTDLDAVFAEHWVSNHRESRLLAAGAKASPFCFGKGQGAICVVYEGNKFELVEPRETVISMSRIGDTTYLVNDNSQVFRFEGKQLIPVEIPKGIPHGVRAIGGISATDRWIASKYGSVVYHDDGKALTPHSIPGTLNGFVARSANDVWSDDGRLHWDGTRWAIVGDVPTAYTLVLRPGNQVLAGTGDGLYEGIPGRVGEISWLPAKVADSGALAAPTSLALAAPAKGYFIEHASLAVNGEQPITTAKRVEVAGDGTMWIEAWDRLVELGKDGKTSVIDAEEKRIEFERWFHPEGAGRGIVTHRSRMTEDYNGRDEIRFLTDGKAQKAPITLEGNDIVAIASNNAGTTWILGALGAGSPYSLQRAMPFEFMPHARVRLKEDGDWKYVKRIPHAAYTDLAVTPEGGVFLAGALTPGPMGEGILVHAVGAGGSAAVTRYRVHAGLLAVTAVSNEEAWAVGAAGLVVHVSKGKLERFQLPSKPWLRACVANGPNDVWIGGDGATLLHYNGRDIEPVPLPLSANAAISGLAFSNGVLWIASPSGLLRLTTKRTGP